MMLREIDRKFYGEGTAAIPAEAGIRRKFGKNDGGRGPKSDISSESYLQTVIRRFKRHHLAAVSLIVLAVIVGAAILAPVIAPYDPNDIAGPFAEGPSKEFWLGTDQIGRDVLSRLLYATRISLLVGVMATLISTGIGVLLGTGGRLFWRCGGYDHYAFYRYGHVFSLYIAGVGGGGRL